MARRAIFEEDGPAAPRRVRPVVIPCRHEVAEQEARRRVRKDSTGGEHTTWRCIEACQDCGAVRVPGGPWHKE